MARISKEVAARVGSTMRQQGIISSQILMEASSGSANAGKDMLTYMLQQKNINESDILNAMAKGYNLPPTDFNPTMLPTAAISLIPSQIVKQHEIVPFALEGNVLHVAVADPMKAASLGPRLKQFNKGGIKLFVAKLSQIDNALKSDAFNETKITPDPKPQDNQQGNGQQESQPQPQARLSAKASSGVVEFVDHILNNALVSEASDIHIEPFRDARCRIRFRINGVLQSQDMYTKYLIENYQAVTTRLKILAECSIQEKRLPQDGVLQFKDKRNVKGDWIDVRFSTLPAKYGERIVMRLLKGSPELALAAPATAIAEEANNAIFNDFFI